jgi:tRNA(Glu) U13 pseudouridine synthase TruD
VLEEQPELEEEEEVEPEENNENAHPVESKAAKLYDLIEYVTAETLKDFTLSDVLMPMLGHAVKLPRNEDLIAIFNDLLSADGLSMGHFHGQENIEATSASGSYRRIVAKPEDVVFDIVDMQNENEDLLAANYLVEKDPTPVIIEPVEGSGLP